MSWNLTRAVREWTKNRYKDTHTENLESCELSPLWQNHTNSATTWSLNLYIIYISWWGMNGLSSLSERSLKASSLKLWSFLEEEATVGSFWAHWSIFHQHLFLLWWLDKNGPQRLTHLNAWSLVSETFWEGLERVVLLEEMNHWRRTLKFQKPTPACVSQPAPCKSDVNFQFLLYHHAHLLLPSADMITMN